MNFMELPGPQFLAFYLILGVGLLVALVLLRRALEPDPHQTAKLTDPYAIAVLRGGPQEAMRLAVTGLIDRSILKVEGDQLAVDGSGRSRMISHHFESAVVEHFSTGKDVKSLFAAPSVLRECLLYTAVLQHWGLVPSAGGKVRNVLAGLAVITILAVVALTKIGMALERHHPFAFLVISFLVFSIVTLVISFPKRTVRGEHFLRDMQRLFKPLRERAKGSDFYANTSELMLLGSVFGIVALPEQNYPYVKTLFAKADAGSGSSCGSSSSCSSSSSCGGGCGGGCGGCGS